MPGNFGNCTTAGPAGTPHLCKHDYIPVQSANICTTLLQISITLEQHFNLLSFSFFQVCRELLLDYLIYDLFIAWLYMLPV